MSNKNISIRPGDRVKIIKFVDPQLSSYCRNNQYGWVDDVDSDGIIWVDLDNGPVIGLNLKRADKILKCKSIRNRNNHDK